MYIANFLNSRYWHRVHEYCKRVNKRNNGAERRGKNLSEKLQRTSGCPRKWLDSLASEDERIKSICVCVCVYVHAFPFGPPRRQPGRPRGSLLRPRGATREILVSLGHLERDKSKVDSTYARAHA